MMRQSSRWATIYWRALGLMALAAGVLTLVTAGDYVVGVLRGGDEAEPYVVRRAREDAARVVVDYAVGQLAQYETAYRNAQVSLLVRDFNEAVARAGEQYEPQLRDQLRAAIGQLDSGLLQQRAAIADQLRVRANRLVLDAQVIDALRDGGAPETALEAVPAR